jgi:hypothetical protein
MHARQYLVLPLLALACTNVFESAAVSPRAYRLSLQQQHSNNRTGISWVIPMEPAKVAQTAELIGVEDNVGTWSIGHATKDFLAGQEHVPLLLLVVLHTFAAFPPKIRTSAHM